MNEEVRIEKDVLGEVEVPIEAYWGINTQRAILNFQISGKQFPSSFIISLATVKKACLQANISLKQIDEELGEACTQAVDEIIIDNKFLDQFPIDVFQTGSGTQTNMNMNEVIANRSNEILGFSKGNKHPIHPNDHINLGHSSNDIIPTAMHLSILQSLKNDLLPAIKKIRESLKIKIDEFSGIIKVGRTHLEDAVPIPLSMEFSVYEKQLMEGEKRLQLTFANLLSIPIGGTAVGTGINAHKDFSETTIKFLKEITGLDFFSNPLKAEGIASHNTLVFVSGILKSIALTLMKIANDIRWMGSGPRAGLGELILPQNEPGSSIMPGKVNPTQSEMLMQVCLQILGNDTIITSAESHGSVLELNTMKPLMIVSILDSINLMSKGIVSFTENLLKGLKPNIENIKEHMERNLMSVTKLTPLIGYDKAAELAMKAYETNKSIKEIVLESELGNKSELVKILDSDDK
ncbi:MAG: class II fumarate hydratase [Candidatus Heimdallarchaeota archaeon]|nr:class II fumarate hydratase [Candidatus Heimdallarchaeota archaeon]